MWNSRSFDYMSKMLPQRSTWFVTILGRKITRDIFFMKLSSSQWFSNNCSRQVVNFLLQTRLQTSVEVRSVDALYIFLLSVSYFHLKNSVVHLPTLWLKLYFLLFYIKWDNFLLLLFGTDRFYYKNKTYAFLTEKSLLSPANQDVYRQKNVSVQPTLFLEVQEFEVQITLN